MMAFEGTDVDSTKPSKSRGYRESDRGGGVRGAPREARREGRINEGREGRGNVHSERVNEA